MMPDLNRIYHGEARDLLATWPSGFVDLCLTSPPYWQVRDYGQPDQLGQEETPETYVDRLVDMMLEVGRVLKPGGSLYLNLGDVYRGRSLLALPWRVSIRLINSGYLLRNCIVWHKRNSLPTSATTRFRNSHEFLFFLTKRPDYYFNLDAVREPHQTKPRRWRSSSVRMVPAGRSAAVVSPATPTGRTRLTSGACTPRIGPSDISCRVTISRATSLRFRSHCARSRSWPVALPTGSCWTRSSALARQRRCRLGRQYLGIDLAAEYVKLAEARLRVTDRCFNRSLRQGYDREAFSQVQKDSSGELSFSPWGQEAA